MVMAFSYLYQNVNYTDVPFIFKSFDAAVIDTAHRRHQHIRYVIDFRPWKTADNDPGRRATLPICSFTSTKIFDPDRNI
jgi:hypothetical protein